MKYERMTSASIREALALAEEILLERLPIERQAADAHSVRFSGGDGTAVIRAHRHGVETQVDVVTDQLRTSRLDGEVQYYMTMLPYQPGEQRGRSSTILPGGLTRQITS